MVNIRLAMIGKRPALAFPALREAGAPKPRQTRNVFFSDPAKPVACPIYRRADLGAGSRIAGPALIEEHGTTTVLFETDALTVAESGEMIVTVGGAA